MVPAAKQEHSQPLQLVLSSTASTHPYHIKWILLSCSRPHGNKQWMLLLLLLNAKLGHFCCAVSPPRAKQLPGPALVLGHGRAENTYETTPGDPRPYMYMTERCWASNNTAPPPVIRSECFWTVASSHSRRVSVQRAEQSRHTTMSRKVKLAVIYIGSCFSTRWKINWIHVNSRKWDNCSHQTIKYSIIQIVS